MRRARMLRCTGCEVAKGATVEIPAEVLVEFVAEHSAHGTVEVTFRDTEKRDWIGIATATLGKDGKLKLEAKS